jgi:hypothetical protein
LTTVKNISALQEVIKEEEFHEQQQEETKESWTTFDGEKSLEPEIEGSLACLSSDPLCIQETNQQILEDLQGVTKEDIQNQENNDYIEEWFQAVIRPKNYFTLQHFLATNQTDQLVSHILASIKVHFLKSDMSLLEIMLRKWLHWKYSYT